MSTLVTLDFSFLCLLVKNLMFETAFVEEFLVGL